MAEYHELSPFRKISTLEFLRRNKPNNVHKEHVTITLNDGTTIERDMGFSTTDHVRARSARDLLKQYPKSVEIKVTGNQGEDWGTYKR